MKRLNPLFLRLLYNKNNTHENFILNYFKSCKFYFYISQLLYFALKRIYLNKRRILIFDTWVILLQSGLFYFFQYFCLTYQISKKSHIFLLKSRLFLLNNKKIYWNLLLKCFFIRLSFFLSKKYSLQITLIPQNLFFLILQGKNLHYLTYKRTFFDYNKFCRLFLITNLSLFFKKADMLTYCFSQVIRKNKKHHQSINWYTQILSFLLKYQPKVDGILVKISGRFNNKMQASHRLITLGKSIRLNTLDIVPNYSYRTIVTPIGVFGIKVWII